MKKILIIIILLIYPQLALAQTTRNPCYLNGQQSTNGIPSCESVSITSPLPVTMTGAASQQVTGNVASGATDVGNPVKIGGVFNTTPPTLTNGQRGDAQLDLNGDLRVAPVYPGGVAAFDGFSNSSVAQPRTTGAHTGLLLPLSGGFIFNGSTWDRQRSIQGAAGSGIGTSAVAIAPTSSSASGITPIVSTSLEACHVLKAGAGNLYSVYAANSTATGGYLVVLNQTSIPADGAIAPLDVAPLPANGFANINYNPGPAAVYSTGITACITSASTPFTKTTGVISAFIKGAVQ